MYDPPIVVGDEGDADSIQEAVDLAPAGAEILVTEGEYEEQVTVDTDDLTIEADGNVTVTAPDDLDGEAVFGITADGVSVDGIDVHAGEDNDGYALMGVSDATVSDADVTHAEHGVYLADGEYVTVESVDVAYAAHGVHVEDSMAVDVHGVDAMDVTAGVGVFDSESVDVYEASAVVAEKGVFLEDAEESDVTMAAIEDAEWGLYLDGTEGGDAYGNVLDGADYGIYVTGDATPSMVTDNEIANASTGIWLDGAEGTYEHNVVDAETGLTVSDADDVTFQLNDLSMSETVVDAMDEEFDARLNYFGERGAYGAVEGAVDYDPFLTAPPEELEDGVDTTSIAVDVTFEADEMHALGVPGPVDGTVGDLFEDDFEGAIYAFDSETDSWEMVDGDADLDALDAVLVVAEEDGHAVMSFDADGPAVPGEQSLDSGWNFVTTSQYDDSTQVFDPDNTERITHSFEQPGAQLGGPGEEFFTIQPGEDTHMIGGESVNDVELSPFVGYFVNVDDDDAVDTALTSSVTAEELYEALDVEMEDDEDEGSADDRDTLDPSAAGVAGLSA